MIHGLRTSPSSLRELARVIGVSEKAVRKAESVGVFESSVCRDAQGLPVVRDFHAAVTAWRRSGRQLRAPNERALTVTVQGDVLSLRFARGAFSVVASMPVQEAADLVNYVQREVVAALSATTRVQTSAQGAEETSVQTSAQHSDGRA
jgi:hypothetical protein